ncbi:uncharacterized protein BDR25DRAFT_339360 [Lindgomyces ingoldianus]|uniref:Uncharacterized protein n=1 Tax=Lindgomyces ingoldianus TaxID=673940 RepID=A0ACB6RCP7_9PLEO|nr:uncharacterized protein BDR25DRAFT_339360 [Lindgomyces ingoldianus]KAF2476292.1 hypothetical protein BDR25DRAFT_339360 [Lindgomyces ingoldianus]
MDPPTPEASGLDEDEFLYPESLSNPVSSLGGMAVKLEREQSTDPDSQDRLQIPSPIPIFPKPLALSYCNFKNHFSAYGYMDGTRMEAASFLVAPLLRHYFPKTKFEYWRLARQDESLFQCIPVDGTTYWMVTTKSLKQEGAGDDSDPSREAMIFQRSLVLLVIIVTSYPFLEARERGRINSINFSDKALGNSGEVMVDETVARRGNVVVLGGRTRPSAPSFEFFTFDVDGGHGHSLVPCFGQPEQHQTGFRTNRFSLETEDVDKVDIMFRMFAESGSGSCVFNANTLSRLGVRLPPLHRVRQRSAESQALHKDLTPEGSDDMTDEYLRSLKINRNGKLLGAGGRFLTKEKDLKAKRLASARGIKFALPEFKSDMDRSRERRDRDRARRKR